MSVYGSIEWWMFEFDKAYVKDADPIIPRHSRLGFWMGGYQDTNKKIAIQKWLEKNKDK